MLTTLTFFVWRSQQEKTEYVLNPGKQRASMDVTKNQFYPISFVPIRFTGYVNWLMDIKHWKMHQCISTRTLYWLSFLGNIISHLDQTSRCCFGQYLSACFRGGQAFSSLWSWRIFDLDNSVDKDKSPTKSFLKNRENVPLNDDCMWRENFLEQLNVNDVWKITNRSI